MLRLTPYRMADIPDLVRFFLAVIQILTINLGFAVQFRRDYRITHRSGNTPIENHIRKWPLTQANLPHTGQSDRLYRYTEADAKWFFENLIFPLTIPSLALLRDYFTSSDPPTIPVDTPMPLSALRTISTYTNDPTLPPGRLIGVFNLFPSNHSAILTDHQTTWDENGDVSGSGSGSEKVIEIAYDLWPELHGRGIGAAMLKAGIEGWIDWLNIPLVTAVRHWTTGNEITVIALLITWIV